ncbi:type II and III secretion system protein family protein [uncultured Halovibrio sp.]|uniref:type II and III secretion system protein family protein n=1 Tax=uncultured Halovibrio sp. TaxID=985049 RepID=UPI0025D28A08|nr:type II and III secretion system protein family protein [uncultured Halovibrio sp.]
MDGILKRACTLVGTAVLLLVGIQAQGEPLELNVGDQSVFNTGRNIDRIAVGNPEVADVEVLDARQVLITGVGQGQTSLRYWLGGASDPREREIKVSADTGVLDQMLNEAGEPGMSARSAGGAVQIRGEPESLASGRQTLSALEEVVDQPVQDATSQSGIQVQADIRVVEVSRRSMKQVGFNFFNSNGNNTVSLTGPGGLQSVSNPGEASVSGDGFGLPISDAFNLVAGDGDDGFLGVMSLLERHDLAHTLAEPSLVTMSGQTATFLAGGEIPIQTDSGLGSTSIEFKEFGVRLKLTPTVLSDNQIVLKVRPEVSEVDNTTSVSVDGQQIPGLTTRRTETTIQLGDGETFVISGLISQETLAQTDRVPFLGSIPVLGSFFRSQRTERSDRELMMVVTPHLVRPMASDADLPPLPGEKLRDFQPTFDDPFAERHLGDGMEPGRSNHGFTD